MAFELDPIFHTETMAKILQSQGHVQLALKVCQQILTKDPANGRIHGLVEKWKMNASRLEPREDPAPLVVEDEDTEPGVSVEELKADAAEAGTASAGPEEPKRKGKLEKLKSLLRKIQERS